MERELELLGPLIGELQRFWNAVEQEDAQAADRMIAGVEDIWPEIPTFELEADEEDLLGNSEAEAPGDLLTVVADVGGVAEALLADDPPLGWCRANLIADLNRFRISGARADS